MSTMRLLVMIAVLSMPCFAQGQDLVMEAHAMDLYKTFKDSETLKAIPVHVDLPDLSLEGGEAIGYFTNEDHKIIAAHVWLFGETGRSFTSFYFQDDTMTLSIETTQAYDTPIGSSVAGDGRSVGVPARVAERWSYFYKGARYFTEFLDAHDTIDIALASDRELITRANDIRDRLKRSIQRDMSDARLVRSVDIAHVLDTVACEPLGCDTMLGHIALLDAGTANAVVGPVPSDELQEDHRDMPQVSFASADGMQFLTLFFHYGGVIDEFSELRVSRRRPLAVRSALPSTDLVSGRGLALDMSEKEVRKVLGENARHGVDMQGHRYLRYRLDDISTSDLLRRYNYPSYYAHLEFEDDKLVEYRFGFDYP